MRMDASLTTAKSFAALIGPRIIYLRRHAVCVDACAFCRHIQRMNKLRSDALTTTATAHGGSPSGRAR
jgi:hypothetical protein